MFKRSRILILVLIVFILRGVFSLPLEARRIKDVKYAASSLGFLALNSTINQTEDITGPIYDYPVITTSHPLATGFWIKQMFEDGLIDKPQTMIYLSPYPFYQVGEIDNLTEQNSNWVRFAFERGNINRVFIINPGYMQDEEYLKERIATQLESAEYDLNLLESFAQLLDQDELGEVIVVVDASYFSNQDTPSHVPQDVLRSHTTSRFDEYPIEFLFSVRNAVRSIQRKNLNITAIVYNSSPGFPFLGHAEKIKELLLFYLGRQR